MRTTIPQQHCRQTTDHPAHTHIDGGAMMLDGLLRCPGRYTPSAHRAPDPSPAQPSDPFAGIDESTAFDASRPAVS